MDVSEAKRLKALEDENRRLKNMVADVSLDNQALRSLLGKKMVAPAAYRQAVGVLRADFKMCIRRAWRVVGLAPSTFYYRSRRPEPVEPVEKLKAHAARRPRWGYRRLHVLLRREGHLVNHKRVYQLYRAHGLAVRRKKRKRLTAAVRTLLDPPTRPNEHWSMDFTRPGAHRSSGGRRDRV